MFINKEIICVGDGYAHGHIWPEWPQIMQALLPRFKIIVISGVGAGQEFLINGLLKIPVEDRVVVFQWPHARRFDKMIQDKQWEEIGKNDGIYHFNFYKRDQDIWWLSSESLNEKIRSYHRFYVQNQQATQRQADQKILLRGYLQSQNCVYVETSTQEQELFSQSPEFLDIRGNQVQPSPLVHYHWLVQIILPQLPCAVDPSRQKQLENLIKNQVWQPFDPDRESIWENMVETLDIDRQI